MRICITYNELTFKILSVVKQRQKLVILNKAKTMAEAESNHLKELSHNRYYEIADDEPDIKHWNIVDDSAKKIGEVKDVLFDEDAKKARYLITNLKDGMMEEDRKVLIPVGRARLDTEGHTVVVPTITRGRLEDLPTYTRPEDVTTGDEREIRRVFAGTEGTETTETYDRKTFYEHEDFNEEGFRRRNR